jgi:hypothetical protein
MRTTIWFGSRECSFSALEVSAIRYSGTQFGSLHQFRLHLLQRDALLVTAIQGVVYAFYKRKQNGVTKQDDQYQPSHGYYLQKVAELTKR